MILSNKRITKALIRLRGCAGWSSLLWFTNHRGQVCRVEAQISSGVHENVAIIVYLFDFCIICLCEFDQIEQKMLVNCRDFRSTCKN